ncbi:glycosyltransferase family A protein [Alishewanella sp. HL-SH06]|uniref:glycosyltransferase family A protein n=1 Tax=Alishewanella sp. HL-SH06 TaxID=3461144 RepID=UPI004043497A
MQNLSFAVAVFAHNSSNTIRQCLISIFNALPEKHAGVFVIANGCTDDTEHIVKQLQKEHENLHLANLNLADKANAWNYYVHNLAPNAALHCFVDGDVQVQTKALHALAITLQNTPKLNAIAGVPIMGRDQQGWTQRMIKFGRVSGGLYALSAHFIARLRQQKTHLPIGFIGEDFLVSLLAKNQLEQSGLFTPSPLLYVETAAGFSFNSLSVLNIKDYWAYFRRLLRYRARDYQLTMLLNYIVHHPGHTWPETIQALYQASKPLPGYYWRGRSTIIDWLVVYNIRRIAQSSHNRFEM